jgi:hypothetical protein
MKSSYLRAATALACALGLSACGGSGGSFQLGGYAYGVTKDGLVLQNNLGSDLEVKYQSGVNPLRFVFSNLIDVDASYNVTVKKSPSNAAECKVTSGGTGRASFNVTNIVVTCTLKTHTLSGNITGTGDPTGLVVVNGKDGGTINVEKKTFEMPPVGEDQAYGITILHQPAKSTCTVAANGVGTMGEKDIKDVVIDCAAPATKTSGE